jgi:His-Xaa-Ser system protein HxsD
MFVSGLSDSGVTGTTLVFDPALVGRDAVLKTCYWFSRDFHCHVAELPDNRVQVTLLPKDFARPEAVATCEGDFFNTAIDFELRSRVEAKTSAVRELILAKAFAESGVLEDQPEGKFSDPVDESRPEGLFRILNSGQF